MSCTTRCPLQLFRSRDMMNVTDLSNSIIELFENCVKYNNELEAFNIRFAGYVAHINVVNDLACQNANSNQIIQLVYGKS